MRTSVSLPGELASYVEEKFSPDAETTAQAIRDAVRHAKHQDEQVEELEEELAEARERIGKLETDLERVRNEKRKLLKQREEHTELVRYAEQRRELVERQEQRRNAPVWRRAKWWVLGGPDRNATRSSSEKPS